MPCSFFCCQLVQEENPEHSDPEHSDPEHSVPVHGYLAPRYPVGLEAVWDALQLFLLPTKNQGHFPYFSLSISHD